MITSEFLTSPSRKRELKENQTYTRIRECDNKVGPFYSLEWIFKPNWLLFMWFASLETVENYICLFIVIWEAIPIRNSYTFHEDINKIIQIIEELGIADDFKTNYSKILDDYRNYRQHNQDLKQKLVNGAWVELEAIGLEKYSYAVEVQLKTLLPEYKKELKKMVFARMESFRSFGSQIQTSNKGTTMKKDDKQEIIKENEKLKNQMAALDDKQQAKINELTSKLEDTEGQLRDLEAKKESLEEQLNKKRNRNEEPEIILYEGNGSKKSKSESKNETEYSIEKSEEELYNKNSEIADLKQENAIATLGKVTDVEWRDDNENNSTQLVKEIESLNRVLNRIIAVKGAKRKCKIQHEAVAELFSLLNCHTSVKDSQMKLVLDAALQQHFIKFILEYASNYISKIQGDTGDITDDKLEAAIQSRTEELIELIDRFEEARPEVGDHSRTLQTTLRQQSYAALGNRGFSINHPFITQLTKDLINEMNKYRIIDSEELNKKFEVEIILIVVKVLRIFHFRLKTQEPIPLMKFYQSGEDIDPVFMEGMWEGPCEDYEVEICSFPVVYTESDERVYTRARVMARPKNETQFSD